MSDYTERGPVPVDDAAVDDPPTVDEVIERQREQHPEQAATSTLQPGSPSQGRRRGTIGTPIGTGPERPSLLEQAIEEGIVDQQAAVADGEAPQGGEAER